MQTIRKAPSLLKMLQATVDELRNGKVAPEDLASEREVAWHQLLGSSASARDRHALGEPVTPDEIEAIRAAERYIGTFRDMEFTVILPPARPASEPAVIEAIITQPQ